ncbi:MAG: hypothetical protein A2W19_12485 [Spirochaetes bacterium RBG_16_49_21]|nr:MAG: hypothetical protein A2W19_12485 [Spirochaetes bacterium RBG_16_49_21]
MPKHFFKLFLLVLLFFPFDSFPLQRILEISGLKIYSEGELIALLNLERYGKNEMPAKQVIDSIVTFYSNNGFTLVKAYVIENSPQALRIYVDEGALGKIIFLNIDDFTTIYLKIVFRLKYKIFNSYTVKENIEKLRNSARFKDLQYQLKPVGEYNTSLFQLDQELNLPIIGKKQLPIFDKFGPRYDLIVFLSKNIELEKLKENKLKESDKKTDHKKSDTEAEKPAKKLTLNKFDYGLRVHYYKGFIPYLKYYHLGLISDGDFYAGEASLGVMYGIDQEFTRPPRLTYSNVNSSYFFTPTFKDIFTPHLRFDLYNSQTARPDLNLRKYDYLTFNAMFAPGITLLSKANLYTGFGAETAYFYNNPSSITNPLVRTLILQQQYDPTQISLGNNPQKGIENYKEAARLQSEIENRTDVYNFVEVGAMYDFAKKSTQVYELRKNRLKKEISVAYDFYFLKRTFHKIRLIGAFDHEFKDRSIYSGMLIYQYLFKDPPFYQEASVNNPAFKGLNASSYFSTNCLSQSNEYRISVYRDFFYVGVYFDMTLFKGSGRDVSGTQFAFAGGPTVRILLLDTFELYLQNGWDYLVSTKKNKSYFYFNIYNKW